MADKQGSGSDALVRASSVEELYEAALGVEAVAWFGVALGPGGKAGEDAAARYQRFRLALEAFSTTGTAFKQSRPKDSCLWPDCQCSGNGCILEEVK